MDLAQVLPLGPVPAGFRRFLLGAQADRPAGFDPAIEHRRGQLRRKRVATQNLGQTDECMCLHVSPDDRADGFQVGFAQRRERTLVERLFLGQNPA